MVRFFKHYIPFPSLMLGCVDGCVLAGVFYAGGAVSEALWQQDTVLNVSVWPCLGFAIVTLSLLIAVGVYRPRALRSLGLATARMLVAFGMAACLLALVALPSAFRVQWWTALAFACGLGLVSMICGRLLVRMLIQPSAWRRRILVLGAGRRAQRLADLSAEQGSGYSIARFIAMGEKTAAIPQALACEKVGNLSHYVAQLGVGQVVLALEERRNSLPLADLLRIKTAGVAVCDYSTFLERETGRVDLDSVNPSWLIFSDGFASGHRVTAALKRVFDIVVSSSALVVTLPIIGLFAVLIRLDSAGPVFFRQQRVGLYGERFSLLKLRSMRPDAESAGAVWASANDPRITRGGRIIRQLRIDELPQLWTVLKGRMSFVGPRPEVPVFVTHLEGVLPFYAERHMVKPGITGWAQINYPYAASVADARAKLEYDLYYAKNYSVFLDFLILLQTLRVILWREGAR